MSEREEALRLAQDYVAVFETAPEHAAKDVLKYKLARALLDCESEKVFAWDVRNDWERSCYAERERAEAAERDLATARKTIRSTIEMGLDHPDALETLHTALRSLDGKTETRCTCGRPRDHHPNCPLRSQEAGE